MEITKKNRQFYVRKIALEMLDYELRAADEYGYIIARDRVYASILDDISRYWKDEQIIEFLMG